MITETPVGWVALAAFLVGLIVRLIKSDGIKIALANLGLPPIPTRALPWLALVLGGAAALLDARVAGASWDAAAQAGLMAAALAVFGHELGSGVPGFKKLLSVAPLLLLIETSSCSALSSKDALTILDILADNTKCAIQNQDLPWDTIVVRCGIRPENVKRVEELVGESRAAGARYAAAARADEHAKASASICADAGAP